MRRGLAVAWGGPLVALALIWLLDLTHFVPASRPGLLVASGAGFLSVVLAAGLYLSRPDPATLRLTFTLQALGVVGLATGWLAAVAF
jgi:hypothetical protein